MKDYTKAAKHCMIIVVLLTEFDQEQYDRIRRREGYEAGVSNGISQGARQKAIEDAINMLKKKYPDKDISEITSLPLEKILELKQQITFTA